MCDCLSGLARVFLFALPCGQRSGKSCKSLSLAGFCPGAGSVQIWGIFMNLVDIHKVSHAPRDGLFSAGAGR